MKKITKDEHIAIGIQFRGDVIERCVTLEKWVETYIALYFTWDIDIALEMMRIVLDRLNFDAKIGTFETMLKKNTRDDFKKTHGKLLSELRFIKDERNKLAHHLISISQSLFLDGYTETIFLENFRNAGTYIPYTKEQRDMIIIRIEKCIEVIDDMATPDKIWAMDESGSPYTL